MYFKIKFLLFAMGMLILFCECSEDSSLTEDCSGPGSSELTIAFNSNIFPSCGSVYSQEKLHSSVVETKPEDCDGNGGNCSYGFGSSNEDPNTTTLWLYTARLKVDISEYTGIVKKISIRIRDWGGPGGTRAFLYDSQGAQIANRSNQLSQGSLETLVFEDGLEALADLAVSGCESQIIDVTVVLC